MLSTILAHKIIDEAKKLIDKDLIIVKTDGKIIASSEESRMGNFHEGAKICVQEESKIIITDEDALTLEGVRAGINLPIMFHGKVIGVIGITGEPNQILPFGELLRKMTELLISESYFSEQIQLRMRMVESFVLDWIQGNEWTAEFLERAHVLKIDLTVKRWPIFIKVNQQPAMLFDSLRQLELVWGQSSEKDMIVQWGDGRFLLLPEYQSVEKTELYQKLKQVKSYLKQRWDLSVLIGVGQIVEGKELGKGVSLAEKALLVSKKSNSIVFEEDLRWEICLQEVRNSTKDEFIKRVIQKLLDQEELLITLKAYFANELSIKKTAAFLHIHINTLHYRIKKIEENTQLDLKVVDDLFNLYLALQFLDEYTKDD
ncbi:CdaR family transcriptional regulator [Bacillus niameyensis]|uniref:CdaR family transcriptional regulator n=1 Tax=Bacillus niameyensis TaxID=1522308 RepID=UPI000783EABA|nr:sugar diacid recognition domain-containing protein [Bacillus niameyensis]